MAIFKEKTEHGYEAVMNIMFGDIDGRLNPDQMQQSCWDYCVLGDAYLKNAEVMLTYLLDDGPNNIDATTMIFPVLFNMWHGLELILKSGNMMCDMYLGDTGKRYTKHTIDVYADEIRAKLKRLGFKDVEDKYLSGMIEFVDECKSKNAHFDFARYANQANGDKQFYNKPDISGTIPILCVDMIELAKVLLEIDYGLVRVVDYLYDTMSLHGVYDKNGLSDEALECYCKYSSFTKFIDSRKFDSLDEKIENVTKEKLPKSLRDMMQKE